MHGIITHEDSLSGSKYKPGLTFKFKLSIPEAPAESYALLVDHDGQNDANVASTLRLAEEGAAPYCISLGVFPGVLLTADGEERNMRMNSYDLFDREYGDFIVYELIPYVTEKYSLKISDSPDMHFVAGGSSGGISAFLIAWFHSDYFHRVYMSSPSFLAMGRGNEIPYLIRKYETKPLRIYHEWSENEPSDYFGWSRSIDEDTREALAFAGYDFNYAYFPGECHCSRCYNEEEAYKRNRWLWKDWASCPVTAPRNSPRVDKIVPPTEGWEAVSVFPEGNDPCLYCGMLEKFHKVIPSNDGLMLYAGAVDEDIVYSFAVGGDGEKKGPYIHATLHTIPRISPKGMIDMAVDRCDRLFVLSAIGIQCVRSFGLIDCILSLPDDSRPVGIRISDGLYVKTEKGIYRRPLRDECVTESEAKRRQIAYYD